ncbi:MAG TPA: hypothetical protein VGO86_12565, partial [Candidatus Dormibacteraeota bacterium]
MVRVRFRNDLLDWTLALVVAAGAVLQQRGGCGCRHDPLWLNLGLVVMATLPIGLRRRQPFPVLLVVGAAALAHIALGFSNQFLSTFAVVVAVFSLANCAPWALSVLGGASVAVLLPASFVVDWHNQGRISLGDVPYNDRRAGVAQPGRAAVVQAVEGPFGRRRRSSPGVGNVCPPRRNFDLVGPGHPGRCGHRASF